MKNYLAILTEIAAETDSTVYEEYSGRGMYGKTCLGISTDSPMEVIELAVEQGIKGAKEDQLGKGYIVYWPQIKS